MILSLARVAVAAIDVPAVILLAVWATIGCASAAYLLPRTGRRWSVTAVGWAMVLMCWGPLSLAVVALYYCLWREDPHREQGGP
jgi:hypothetical protein